jgi:hypothetical protein
MFKDDVNKQAQQHKKLIEEITHQVNLEAEVEVPNWNRAAAFEENSNRAGAKFEQAPWWHWQSFGGLAFAMSLSVVALFSAFINKDNRLDQQAIAMLVKEQVAQQLDVEVNRKLKEFASEQQVVLANYRAELSERQEKSNLQLAGYVMSSTRIERQEDMADFVSFINAQRKDEQLDQKIRFKQLEQAIGYRKASFTKTSLNNTESADYE